MADSSAKKLLVALKISTSDWQKTIGQIKDQLKQMNADAVQSHQEKLSRQQQELELTKQQIAEQKVLQAQAAALAAFDKAKSAWQKQQQDAIKTQLTQTMLQTAEAKKQSVESQSQLKLQQEQLKLEQQSIRLQQQKAAIAAKQTADQTRQIAAMEAAASTQAAQMRSSSVVSNLQKGVESVSQPAKLTSTAEQQVAEAQRLVQARALLAVQEAQLKVLATQEGAKKEDVAVVAKQLAGQKELLTLDELRLKQQQTLLAEQTAQQEKATHTQNVSQIQNVVAPSASTPKMSAAQLANLEKLIAEERAKLEVQSAQLKVLSSQETYRKEDIAAVEKDIAAERTKLNLLEAQAHQQVVQAQPRGGGEGGGGVGGIVTGGLGALIPGFGEMAAAVAAGTLITEVFTKAGESLRDFGKELINATGSAGQLREQFGKLASGSGVDPEEFLNKLRVATRGLVEDNTQLIKVANQFMQGPLKLQPAAIEKLMSVTINLARAQGKDATEAMGALSRAALTGRTQTLAMAVGISRAELSVNNLGRGVNQLAKEQIQLAMTMDAMTRRLAEVGTPATTLKELFSQLHMVQGAFVEDMAYSVTHTKAFADMIQQVSDWMQKATPVVLNFAKNVGQYLGTAFAYVTPLIEPVWHLIVALSSAIKELVTNLVLTSPLTQFGNNLNAAGQQISPFRKAIAALGITLETAAFALSTFAASWKLATGLITNQSTVSDAFKTFGSEVKQATQTMITGIKAQRDALAAPLESGQVEGGKSGTTTGPDQEQASVLRENAMLRLKIKEEEEKAKLDLALEEIAQEKEANQQSYADGLESLEQYVASQRSLLDKEHQARLAQIHADTAARKEQLAQEAKGISYVDTNGQPKTAPGMDPTTLALKSKEIDVQDTSQTDAENKRSQQEQLSNAQKLFTDQIAARRAYVEAVNKIEAQGVSDRTAILEKEFAQGSVNVNSYIAQRKELAKEEMTLANAGAQATYEASAKNADSLAKLNIAELENEVKYQNEITKLIQTQGELRIQYLEKQYDIASKYLQADLKQQQSGPQTTQNQGAAQTDITALIGITQKHIDDLQKELNAKGGLTSQNADAWLSLSGKIAEAKDQVYQFNLELAKSHDIVSPLAGLMDEIAVDMGDKMSSGWKEMLTTMSKQLKIMGEYLDKQKAARAAGQPAPNQFQDLGTSIRNLFRPVPKVQTVAATTSTSIFEQGQKVVQQSISSSAQVIDTAFKGVSGTIDGFKDTITSTVEALRQFSTTLTGVKASAPGVPFGPQPVPAGGNLGIAAPASQLAATGGNVTAVPVVIVGDSPTSPTMSASPLIGKKSGAGQATEQITTSLGKATMTVDAFTKAMQAATDAKINPTVGSFSNAPYDKSATVDISGSGDASAAPQSLSSLSTNATQASTALQQLTTSAQNASGAQQQQANGSGGDQSSQDKMMAVVQKVMSVAQNAMNAVSTIMNAKSAGQGAVGGAMSGASLGMAAGPYGAIAGAVIGGIAGGIVGSKRAAVTQDLAEIKTQMDGIIQSMNEGTITLGQAIADLRKERQQAISMLGGEGKKGGKQIPAAISAIDSQIQQLLDEQKQIIDNMNQQIIELGAPTAFQPIVDQLDTIIQKYQQFASAAAGNTQEVAAAQDYLTEALQNYATTISTQLNEANQTAINDALTLLNLEQQRADLINSEAQQEYNIMTQGVLTRNQGTAANKGEEIAQLRYQRDQQLQQMDEEISLAQYKVNAEQKIFGLASDRVSLESQLLALQEVQTDQQMANIIALQQTLEAISTGNISSLSAISANGSLQTGSTLLNEILSLLGLSDINPPGDSGTNYLAEIPQEWQGISQFIDNALPNWLRYEIEALMTPPGSSAREQLVNALDSDYQSIKTDAKAAGYDVSGYESFLNSALLPAGSAIPPASADNLTGYSEGGPVARTEPALVHKGEWVIPEASASQLPIAFLQTLVSGIASPGGKPLALPGQSGTAQPAAPSANVSRSSATSIAGQVSNTGIGLATNTLRLNIEGQIYSMASARASLEMQVVSARSALLQQEAAHMQLMQQLMQTITSTPTGYSNPGVQSLEGAFQKIYELRGRYGSGGFTRQTL